MTNKVVQLILIILEQFVATCFVAAAYLQHQVFCFVPAGLFALAVVFTAAGAIRNQ